MDFHKDSIDVFWEFWIKKSFERVLVYFPEGILTWGVTCKSEHIRKGFELEFHLPEADGSDREEFNEFRGNIGNQFEVFVFEASWLKMANT